MSSRGSCRDGGPQDVRVVPHSFYIGPGLLATLHALSVRPRGALVEWMFAQPEAHLFQSPILPVDGVIEVPQGPSLGCDPDPEVISAYRTD